MYLSTTELDGKATRCMGDMPCWKLGNQPVVLVQKKPTAMENVLYEEWVATVSADFQALAWCASQTPHACHVDNAALGFPYTQASPSVFSICKAERLLDLLVVKLNGICSGLMHPPPRLFSLRDLVSHSPKQNKTSWG